MNNVDERLKGIENRVEMLLECQCLSRFDNLMFLMYPLLILATTVSLTIAVQYGAMQKVFLWYVRLTDILDIFRILLFIGLGAAFVRFCHAYAKDSIRGRMTSVRILLWVLPWIAFGVGGLFLYPKNPTSLFPTPTSVLPLLLTVSIAVRFSADVTRDRGSSRIVSWFESAIPLTLKAAQVSLVFETSSTKLAASHGVKFFWSVSFVMYLMILTIATCRGQLGGETVSEALCGAGLFTAIEVLILRRL
jgi:hypothetical protein